MHEALAVLTARKAQWATLPVREKVVLLEELKARIGRLNREDWAREAVQVTGVDPDMVAPAPEPPTCTRPNAARGGPVACSERAQRTTC